jgi:hypothetical protein
VNRFRAARIKYSILDNLGFKIVALVVAVVVWFGVKSDRQTEIRYPVQLELQPPSEDETILGPVPARVDVIFAGAGKDLLRLGDVPYRVRKRLEPGPLGPRRVILEAQDVVTSGTSEVKPVAVSPNVITLTLDRLVSKRVPVRSRGELEPADGYHVQGPVRFEPSSVTLIGARTLLSQIDSVAVDVGRFRGSRAPIRQAVAVGLPQYPSVIVQPDSIRVVVSVHEAEREATRPDRS